MTQKRIRDVGIYNGLFACLRERPMTMTEIAERVLHDSEAVCVGRVALRLESLIASDIVVPMVVKGKLFFRLNEIKAQKVI